MTKASRWSPLSSVEEDALGEELRVLSELEPGRAVRDTATLPTFLMSASGFQPTLTPETTNSVVR